MNRDIIEVFLSDERLQSALADEEEALRKARKIAGELPDGAKSVQATNLSQDWLAALSQFLAEYRRAEYSGFQRGSEVFERIQRLLEMLSVGTTPDAVNYAITNDGNHWAPQERRDIAFAVCYVEAAKKNEIDDKSYNKTVSEYFDVQPQTVRRWVRNRDVVCKNVEFTKTKINKENLKLIGKRYQNQRTGRKASPK